MMIAKTRSRDIGVFKEVFSICKIPVPFPLRPVSGGSYSCATISV